MMEEIATKSIFKSKYVKVGKKETYGRIQQLISNNCEEFAVTVRSLRDHFTNLIKRYKSKARLEMKNTSLGGEELSENKQLLEDIIERFEESKRRTKADTKKRQTILKTKSRKLKK